MSGPDIVILAAPSSKAGDMSAFELFHLGEMADPQLFEIGIFAALVSEQFAMIFVLYSC